MVSREQFEPERRRRPAPGRREATAPPDLGSSLFQLQSLAGNQLVTAVSGLALGTIFGRIHGLVDLASPYGVGWVAAIIGVAAIFATGARVSSPALRRLFDTEDLWIPTVDGTASGPLVNAVLPVACESPRVPNRGQSAMLGETLVVLDGKDVPTCP